MPGPFLLQRRVFVASLLAGSFGAFAAPAPRPEKSRITVAAGGKSALALLPLTVAEQLGFFRSEGLSVEIAEAGGSQRALDMQLEGAAEVCAGPFDQTLQLQARGQAFQAFVLMSRTPQLALGVSMRNLPNFKSLAELRGRRIALAEGAAASLMLRLLLARGGLRPEEVTLADLSPAGAVMALRSGQVDAVLHAEPVLSTLEQKAEVRILADTRSVKGAVEVFGGPMPSSCLYAPQEFVQRHPGICQAMAHGIVHALKWLQTAGPGDMLKAVPESYLLGDRALYLTAFNKIREAFSPDGLLPLESAKNAVRVLSQLEGLKTERMDVAQSFTNEFSRKAKERYRA